MKIIARKLNKCAYPPIGKYIGSPPVVPTKFEQYEIKDKNFVPGTRLKQDGVKQSQSEARILGNIRAIDQGRAPVNGDVLSYG